MYYANPPRVRVYGDWMFGPMPSGVQPDDDYAAQAERLALPARLLSRWNRLTALVEADGSHTFNVQRERARVGNHVHMETVRRVTITRDGQEREKSDD